jgi:hypothetical protein
MPDRIFRRARLRFQQGGADFFPTDLQASFLKHFQKCHVFL